MRRRRLALALSTALSLTAAGAATSYAQGDDWDVERDPFDKGVVARYKAILSRDPGDSGALSKLVSMYRNYRSMAQLIGEYEKELEKDANDFAALAILGHLQLQEGAHDKALAYYERAAAQQPNDTTVQIALGGLYQRNGKNDLAKGAFDKALLGKPSAAQKIKVLRALADLALFANDIEAARGYYEQYFAADPKNIQARVELGDALAQHGRYADAIAIFKEAEEKYGRDPVRKVEVVARIGKAHEDAKQTDDALREYRRAIGMVDRTYYIVEELTTRIIEIYRQRQDLAALLTELEGQWPVKSRGHFEWSKLAGLYQETGNAEKSIEALQKAVQKAPYELDTQDKLIQQLKNAGREDDALKQLEKVVAVAPGEARFQSALAERYWEHGDQKKALALLKKMEERFSGDAGAYATIADLYTRWGKEDLALAAYERLTRIEPDDPRHLETLGDQYYTRGDKDKAVNVWKKIAASGKADGLAELGKVYADHDMLPDALAAYAKAIKLEPKNHEHFIGRAGVLERQKAYVDAINDWERALALLPDKASSKGVRREGRRRIVNLLVRAGGSKESDYRTRWLNDFRANPPDLEAGYFLVELYGRRPAANEPRATLEKILKIKPDDMEAMDELVKAYKATSKYDEAIALLEKMIGLAPAREREFFNQIAAIKTLQKKDDEAIFYAQKALDKNPNDPQAHEAIAERYVEMQRIDDAIKSYEKSLQLDGRVFRVHFALAQLYLQTTQPAKAAELYRLVLKHATEDEILTRAGKEAIDLEEITGTLGELEKVVAPLSFTYAHKDIYRKILVDLYRRYVQRLTDRAASGDSATRREVRAELDRLGKHGLNPMLEALNDETDPVQQAIAVDVLGHLGNKGAAASLVRLARKEPAPDPAGPRRIGTLSPVDWKVRVAALVAAGRLGDSRIIDQVLPLVGHEEVSVREAAIFTLGRTGDKKVLPQLGAALSDRRESVQVLACLGRAQSGDAKAPARMTEVVADIRQHDLTRGACAYALGAIGATAAVSALSDAVLDGGGQTQRLAAWALGRLGDKKAIPSLLQAYFSRDEAVRNSALAAMARLAGAPAAAEDADFGDYPMDDYKYDVTAAVAALGRTPATIPVAPDIVGVLLAGREQDVETGLREALTAYRDMALRVLLDLDGRSQGDRIGLGPLTASLDGKSNAAAEKALSTVGKALRGDVEALLTHADAKVRMVALSVLARIAAGAGIAPEIEPALVKGLTDKVEMVRAAAARAVVAARAGAAAPGGGATVTALVTLLGSKTFGDRAVAAVALGALGAGEAELIKALADDSEFVREEAARALGAMRSKEAVTALITASSDETPGVRRACAIALTAIGDDRARARLAEMASGDPDEAVKAAAAGKVAPGTKK